MNVNLSQDDLSTFIHKWEVAGMSHALDERTPRDILPRQIRRRDKEGTPTHSYTFLIQSIRDPYEGKGPLQSR